MATAASPPVELVAGKYRLTRLLGRGGMGSVWEGVHSTLGTRVAVKFIESDYIDSSEARERFENEARAAAQLSSKHVVKVHDHGVMSDGRPYIVMEFLDGESLDARLARGRLSLQQAAQIMTHVCRALARAHEAGIVHRDLKPENVFLVKDEDDGSEIAKVVDFGIAKFTSPTSGLSSSTRTGAVLGTPFYMSPEQARGLRSVDYRTDLWAVGVLTYRCVVGELPFNGEAVGDLLVKICVAPLPVASQQLPGLPATFDAWLARALAREPGDRFQSALELAAALSGVAGLTVPIGSNAHAAAAPLSAAQTVVAPPSYQPVSARGADGVTAAPFTTQNALPVKKSAPVAIIVGGLVAVSLVVGIVGVVVLRRSAAASVSDSTSEVTAVPAATGAATPAEPTPTASAPTVVPTASEPAPLASAAPSAEPAATSARPPRGSTPPPKHTGKTPAKQPGQTDLGY